MSKFIGIKLTKAEYEKLQFVAGGRSISATVKELIKQADSNEKINTNRFIDLLENINRNILKLLESGGRDRDILALRIMLDMLYSELRPGSYQQMKFAVKQKTEKEG